MWQHELLAAGSPARCAYCPGEIAAGAAAWWDDEHAVWICTTCVPANESTAHSIGHAFARDERRSYAGLFSMVDLDGRKS